MVLEYLKTAKKILQNIPYSSIIQLVHLIKVQRNLFSHAVCIGFPELVIKSHRRFGLLYRNIVSHSYGPGSLRSRCQRCQPLLAHKN